MLRGGLEEPFTVYQVLPRSPILFSDQTILRLNLGGSLLTVVVEPTVDFFSFFRDLVRYCSCCVRSWIRRLY